MVVSFFFTIKEKKSQKLSSHLHIIENVMLDVYLPSSQNFVPGKFGPKLVHLSEFTCSRP